MIAVDALNPIFETLCDELNRGGLNYTATVRVFRASGKAGKPLVDIVTSALARPAVIGGSAVATISDVLQEFNFGMNYIGDRGAHPTPGHVDSPDFVSARTRALELIECELASSDAIFSFWLKEGHPFYPVFWDFAFLIEQAADAFVFIGSSSD